MAATPTHSSEQHKKAFELFFDLRSMNAVANQTGVDNHTLRRWSRGEINCDCPYHNWAELVKEREVALVTRMDLIAKGIVDPLEHEQALLDAEPCRIPLTEVQQQAIRPASKVMDRGDRERLSQFELIYAKLFFHITGCVIDHGTLLDGGGELLTVEQCKKYFDERGLAPKNLEQCVKVLIQVTEEIRKIREELGLRTSRPQPTPTATPAELPRKDAPKPLDVQAPLTITELKNLKDRMELMSPQEVRALGEQMRASDEENTIEVVVPPPK